jgi:hypothetical protein
MNTMLYHILNGDCLAQQLREINLEGIMIVCREGLVEGPVNFDTLDSFWKNRSDFIQATHGDSPMKYSNTVVAELSRIESIPPGAEVCLWFEHDLFCQVNMWFVMALCKAYRIEARISIVYPVIPPGEDIWKGFGLADAATLRQAYAERIQLSAEDHELGVSLWQAYAMGDMQSLIELSEQNSSPAFRYIKEVCKACAERLPGLDGMGRPERLIKDLMAQTQGDFRAVFAAFSSAEGIYGYGDLQVRHVYDRLMQRQ